MSTADDVVAAIAGDAWWLRRDVTDGQIGADERSRSLDDFEQVSGLQLPAEYRYLAVHHQGFISSDRMYSDIDRDEKFPIGPLRFSDIEIQLRSYTHFWSSGTFMRQYLVGDADHGDTVEQWIPYLYPLFDSDDSLVMLDYRFDSSNPPLVAIDSGVAWASPPPAAKAVFVADSLLSFLQLELRTEENYYGTPPDPPTERCVQWTEWRNNDLIPGCV